MARATAASAAASTMTKMAMNWPSSPKPWTPPFQLRTAEGDEIQVGAVEHQFDAHQHPDGVPLDRHADHAADEEDAPTTGSATGRQVV